MKRLSFILSFIVCICVANTNDVFSQKRELQQFKGKVTNLQGEPARESVGVVEENHTPPQAAKSHAVLPKWGEE